jgi:hypothetical protein
MALPAHLRPDCLHCAALCCVAPPFDATQGFGHDKAAGEACIHLQADDRCGIHASLIASGYPGCAAFDCFGAGQKVTQRFAGRSWRQAPEDSSAMFAAYARMRALHELLAMAWVASERAADDRARSSLQEVLAGLEQLCEIEAPVDVVVLRQQTLRKVRDALSIQGSA